MATLRIHEINNLRVYITNVKNIINKYIGHNNLAPLNAKALSTAISLTAPLPFILNQKAVNFVIESEGKIKYLQVEAKQTGIVDATMKPHVTNSRAKFDQLKTQIDLKEAFTKATKLNLTLDDHKKLTTLMHEGNIITDLSVLLKDELKKEGGFIAVSNVAKNGKMSHAFSILILPIKTHMTDAEKKYIEQFVTDVASNFTKLETKLAGSAFIKNIKLKTS